MWIFRVAASTGQNSGLQTKYLSKCPIFEHIFRSGGSPWNPPWSRHWRLSISSMFKTPVVMIMVTIYRSLLEAKHIVNNNVPIF